MNKQLSLPGMPEAKKGEKKKRTTEARLAELELRIALLEIQVEKSNGRI